MTLIASYVNEQSIGSKIGYKQRRLHRIIRLRNTISIVQVMQLICAFPITVNIHTRVYCNHIIIISLKTFM